MRKNIVFIFIAIFVSVNSFHCLGNNNRRWPRTVLITNDDGINDSNMINLARAFSKIANTYVVAPLKDCSGSSHYMILARNKKIKAERRNIGSNITAYAVDGFPADCVILALGGIMKDNPPDLVISGINGGPNFAYDWIFSGTIGAARIAAFWGVPAIAISGLDNRIQGSTESAINWIIKLSQSKIIKEIIPPQYITVSIPRVSPSTIKGVCVAKRAGLLFNCIFKKEFTDSVDSSDEIWVKEYGQGPTAPESSDVVLYYSNYIVIVPMIADENDYKRLFYLKKAKNTFPEWKIYNNSIQ